MAIDRDVNVTYLKDSSTSYIASEDWLSWWPWLHHIAVYTTGDRPYRFLEFSPSSFGIGRLGAVL